eukprot:TRINITY_DN36806_c0_g1_i1.p2 TRINITY_DN36806_c0_g1~~TRINITY_DN36806_c0_g1_i1.p2  ORF type:complete len:236 (-),score=60.09 TRINITY_DN36806_c0_g1_i1:211-918(-)
MELEWSVMDPISFNPIPAQGQAAASGPSHSAAASESCRVFNTPAAGDVDHPEAITPPEILSFLSKQRDICLASLARYAGKGTMRHGYDVHHHPPVYTCAEAAKYGPKLDPAQSCGEMKNLFLRDKKKNLYLISALESTKIDLKNMTSLLGAKGSVGFANQDRLKETLNLIPGSVTPFGLMNDTQGQVTYFLDRNAMEQREYLVFHPCASNCSVSIHREDFVAFIEQCCGHRVNLM